MTRDGTTPEERTTPTPPPPTICLLHSSKKNDLRELKNDLFLSKKGHGSRGQAGTRETDQQHTAVVPPKFQRSALQVEAQVP